MPKTYPADVRLRAIALATATDLRNAANLTGIPAETVSRWVDEYGDVRQSDLDRLLQLAQSELTVRLAKGETRGMRDLTVTVGVLMDKRARYQRAEASAEPDWHDRLNAWVDATYPPDVRPLAQRAITRQLTAELREMQSHPDYVPEPTALAPPDPEAEAALFEAFKGFLEGIRNLEAWHAAWDERERARQDRQRLVSARAHVLHTDGGMHYHQALALAEEITE